MIELYAITDDLTPPLPQGARLRIIGAKGLAAICATAGAGELTAERLWQHEHIIESLAESRDVLPVRYGTRLPDDRGAIEVLERRHLQFRQSLERVRGAIEVSVRVIAGDEARSPASVIATSGTEYLRAKARTEAERAEATRAVHEPLCTLARDSMLRPTHVERELLRAAYLVDRRARDRFVRRVAELQRERPSLQLLCTGPWPPYSFVQ